MRSFEITPLVTEPDTQFNAPRWSPDGRSIVVERQRRGEQAAIVVVDMASGTVRPIASSPETRWATPAWRRDGAAVIAAAATGDGPFNLHEIDLASLRTRQLTYTTGGATWPDVSPDGALVVYVGYTAGGFDLFQMPYPVAASSSRLRGCVPRSRGRHVGPRRAGDSNGPPLLAVADHGADIMATHRRLVERAPSRSARSRRARMCSATTAIPCQRRSATKRRLRPPRSGPRSTGISRTCIPAGSRRSLFPPERHVVAGGPPTDDGRPSPRLAGSGTWKPAWSFRSLTPDAARSRSCRSSGQPIGSRRPVGWRFDRGAIRMAWAFQSAHVFANSISPERGLTIGATTELVREGLGSIADARTSTVDARVYLPGLATHHVLAVRVAGGTTRGDRLVGRIFLLGGGGSNSNTLSFDSEALSLLRGFREDSFAGTHSALVNVDYRWPLVQTRARMGDLAGVPSHAARRGLRGFWSGLDARPCGSRSEDIIRGRDFREDRRGIFGASGRDRGCRKGARRPARSGRHDDVLCTDRVRLLMKEKKIRRETA